MLLLLRRASLVAAAAFAASLGIQPAGASADTVTEVVDLGVTAQAGGTATWDETNRSLHMTTTAEGVVPGVSLGTPWTTTMSDPDGACGGPIAAGDLDGDGDDEVVIGCPAQPAVLGAPAGSGGAVTYRFEGGVPTTPQVMVPPAVQANAACGAGLAIGDVNGDDRDDVALACPGQSVDAVGEAGVVLVFLRSADGGGFLPPVWLADDHLSVAARCGASAVAIGDVSDDGLGDVVVGCRGMDRDASTPDTGGVLVFLRTPDNTGFRGPERLTRELAAAGDYCGSGVAIGDFDGDGVAGVAQACPGVDGAFADVGELVVSQRAASGTWVQRGVASSSSFSFQQCSSVVGATLDRRRGRDLLLGCSDADPDNIESGRITPLVGRDTGRFDAEAPIDDPLPAPGSRCGAGLAAPDLNADGLADVLMGCPGDGTLGSGRMHAFVRSPSGAPALAATFDPTGPTEPGSCAEQVVAADVDADGRDEGFFTCHAGGATRVYPLDADPFASSYPAAEVLETERLNRTVAPVVEASLDPTLVTNGQGVAFELSNDAGRTWTPAADGAPVVFTTRGDDLRARATFTSNGRSTSLVTALRITYVVDTRAPTVTCSSSPRWSRTGTIRCVADDDGPLGPLQASWRGSEVSMSPSGELDLASLPHGDGRLEVRIVDRVGRDAILERTLGIDRRGPRLVPGTTARRLNGWLLFGRGAGPLRVVDPESGLSGARATLDWRRIGVVNGAINPLRIPHGRYTMRIVARDRLGNRSSMRVRIMVDRIAPTVRGVAHFYQGLAYVQARDSLSGIAAPIRVRITERGVRRFRVRVVDRAGNAVTRWMRVQYHMSLTNGRGNRQLPFAGWRYYTSDAWIARALRYDDGYSSGAAARVMYREIQWRLTVLHYLDPGNVTGTANLTTIRAIQAYQRDHGLPPLGTVGRRTRQQLDADLRAIFFAW